jgi:hypothetical protein
LPSFVEALSVVPVVSPEILLLELLGPEEVQDFLAQQQTVLVDFQAKVESALDLVALVVLELH